MPGASERSYKSNEPTLKKNTKNISAVPYLVLGFPEAVFAVLVFVKGFFLLLLCQKDVFFTLCLF